MTLPGAVLVCTKLDLDFETAEPTCRIMFCGNMVHLFEHDESYKALKLYKVASHLLIFVAWHEPVMTVKHNCNHQYSQ